MLDWYLSRDHYEGSRDPVQGQVLFGYAVGNAYRTRAQTGRICVPGHPSSEFPCYLVYSMLPNGEGDAAIANTVESGCMPRASCSVVLVACGGEWSR